MAFNNKEEWLKEFTEFSKFDTTDVKVPAMAFENLKKRLFPNPWTVFGKIAVIHAVLGFLSLAVCNQFGLNPFQTDQSLTNWFMKVAGHNFCMLLCGTFFMATTFVFANLFLSLEELESIKRYEWLQTGIMGLVSLAAFYYFGAELVGTFVALWILGALIGGLLSVEGSYRLRRSFT
ncbi:MAG: hypothetical protein B7Y39_08530 [Bdellovibrio sp. 28-41-41]|nr:MAG: hypothetical protein B7Y39_08530 [Bdellovibrio sp. 28-41-41]